MSWRTIIISKRAKLDLQMGSMVVRGETTIRIHISEIACLMIESTAVSMTAALLSELTKNKVKIIFCDEQRNPQSELIPYYGCHDCSAKLKSQLMWNEEIKGAVWTEIVREKIRQQYAVLQENCLPQASDLQEYINSVQYRDETNREGHAAKVYFNALFGYDFSRSNDSPINAALNYGYSILLSAVNREIAANGYLTQIGLFHDNMFNYFNLGSDLMEPFRPLVDAVVYELQPEEFEKQERLSIVSVLQQTVTIDNQEQYVSNAIKLYCKSVFDALNECDITKIRFYRK